MPAPAGVFSGTPRGCHQRAHLSFLARCGIEVLPQIGKKEIRDVGVERWDSKVGVKQWEVSRPGLSESEGCGWDAGIDCAEVGGRLGQGGEACVCP